jgi:serine/threonine protein kinase
MSWPPIVPEQFEAKTTSRPSLRTFGWMSLDVVLSSVTVCRAEAPARDLKERLQRGRLDPANAIGIVAQAASALDAAHARGLVHRDVKPSNVLLDTGARPDGSGHVYLADFGLTQRISEEVGIGDDGHLMGTTVSRGRARPPRRRNVAPRSLR